MRKTIEQHLQDLPEPARSRALKNMYKERSQDYSNRCSAALNCAFRWHRTDEGYKYWFDIFLTINEQLIKDRAK